MSKLNTYGCGVRSLLKQMERRGTPLSEEEFLARFSPLFPKWQTHCGLTDDVTIIQIASNLGLCTCTVGSRDFDYIEKNFDPSKGAIVTMHRNLDGSELHHIMLLLEAKEENLRSGRHFKTARITPFGSRARSCRRLKGAVVLFL